MSIICGCPPWPLSSTSLRIAGPRDAFADLGPQSDERFRRQRQCARKRHMLVRLSHRHQWQECHRQIVRHERNKASDDAADDRGIDTDRQVRPVLLDGRDRQHGNDAFALDGAPNRPSSCLAKVCGGSGAFLDPLCRTRLPLPMIVVLSINDAKTVLERPPAAQQLSQDPMQSAAKDSSRIRQTLLKLQAIASGIQEKAIAGRFEPAGTRFAVCSSASRGGQNNGKSFCLNRLE